MKKLTSYYSNRNIALLLVENGLASVVRHRKDDEDRSPIYDELLAAEETYFCPLLNPCHIILIILV